MFARACSSARLRVEKQYWETWISYTEREISPEMPVYYMFCWHDNHIYACAARRAARARRIILLLCSPKTHLLPGMIISARSVLLFFLSKEWSTSENCTAELSTIFKYRREKMMHDQKIFFVLLDQQDHEGGTLVRPYTRCDKSKRAAAYSPHI